VKTIPDIGGLTLGEATPGTLRHPTAPRTTLLLQGPVGPFFQSLRIELKRRGYAVERVLFAPGDRTHAALGDVRFAAGPLRWRCWLEDRMARGDLHSIVLFGANRPYHRIARDAAEDFGIPALCLEEGYIRPGYVTAEWGGNNAISPLRMPRIPTPHTVPGTGPDPCPHPRATAHMCLHGSIHYARNTLFASKAERRMAHRDIAPLTELCCWARNAWRAATRRTRDIRTVRRLATDSAHFVVALQVLGDANLGRAALGWSSSRLIVATTAAFARAAPSGARLVFKVHPMDRGHFALTPLIRATARANGVADRVALLFTGPMNDLLRHAAGLITINSGAGLGALHHGVPLLVVGDALYARPGLAVCGRGQPDFDRFFAHPDPGDARARAAFLTRVRAEALLPGDFYSPSGRRRAAAGVADRLAAAQPVSVTDATAARTRRTA
jgi:capsular polysaccharide export protein